MIEVDDKLVSLDVFEKKFACDLASCKGACCVKGDSGAPLTRDEIQRINDSIDQIKPNMRPEGLKAIKEKGIYYIDEDNEPVTTLVNGEECAFVYFDSNQVAKCAIEKTYKAKGKASEIQGERRSGFLMWTASTGRRICPYLYKATKNKIKIQLGRLTKSAKGHITASYNLTATI